MTGIQLPWDPKFFLLCDFSRHGGISKFKYFVANALVVTKLLIASLWKRSLIPSKQDWIIKFHYVLLMNKLSAITRYRSGVINVI